MGRIHTVSDVTAPTASNNSNPNNVVFRPAHSSDGTIKSDVYMGYYKILIVVHLQHIMISRFINISY